MPYPWLLHPVSLSLRRSLLTLTSTGDTQTLKGRPCSVFGVSWCAQGFVWAFWASLAGMGFDSKCDFTPPTILLGILLCPCMWGIFFFFFLVGSNILLSMVVQQPIVILEFSQEKMSTCPSTPPSWLGQSDVIDCRCNKNVIADAIKIMEMGDYPGWSGCTCAKSLQSCPTATLWTVACHPPPSMGFSRQEYWSGLPCPSRIIRVDPISSHGH